MTLTRRAFLGSGAALGLAGPARPPGSRPSAFAFASGALHTPSRPAQHGRQVAGIYRMKVGAIEVSALLDGYLDLDIALLSNADPADASRLLERSFHPKRPYRASVNAVRDQHRREHPPGRYRRREGVCADARMAA